MADSLYPTELQQDKRRQVLLWHTVYGVFFWEFFTTIDYELRVFRGYRPYRWTIWIYSITRVACVMVAILSIVLMDATTPINCQLWIVFERTFAYLSLAAASLLIVLRVIAIWNKHRVAMGIAIGIWGINVVLHIQDVARLRSTWIPAKFTCVVDKNPDRAMIFFSMAVTDIALLLILLIGLLRLRRRGGRTFGLNNLLWKQGLIWAIVATAAEVPPAVFVVLNLSDQLNFMFQGPAVVTMTIAATRMYRSLVDFTSGPLDVVQENSQINRLRSMRIEQTHPASIVLNPMKISVPPAFEQHPIS